MEGFEINMLDESSINLIRRPTMDEHALQRACDLVCIRDEMGARRQEMSEREKRELLDIEQFFGAMD